MGSGSASRDDRGGALAAPRDAVPVRVLFVADRVEVSVCVGELLAKSDRQAFSVVDEVDLERAARRARDADFDLLLLDLALAGRLRAAPVDLASELATRPPGVLHPGTEGLPESLDEIDLPALLVRTLRRARRLGRAPQAPVFCRLERPFPDR